MAVIGTITIVTGTDSATLSWPAASDNIAVAGYEYSIDGGATVTSYQVQFEENGGWHGVTAEEQEDGEESGGGEDGEGP